MKACLNQRQQIGSGAPFARLNPKPSPSQGPTGGIPPSPGRRRFLVSDLGRGFDVVGQSTVVARRISMMMQAVSRGMSSSRASSSPSSPYVCYKNVLVGVSDAFCRSNLSWRQKFVAFSFVSDSSGQSKRPKKLTKQERRAMVESFVEKYRENNAGKFPSVSSVKEKVGGGFYNIRGILQELEYKSKYLSTGGQKTEKNVHRPSLNESKEPHSAPISSENSTLQELSDQAGNFTEAQEIKTLVHQEEIRDELFYAEERHLKTEAVESVLASVSSLKDPLVESLPAGAGSSAVAFSSSDDTQESLKNISDGPQKENDTRKEEHEESASENPSVWGNLTSLARSIIGFFKV